MTWSCRAHCSHWLDDPTYGPCLLGWELIPGPYAETCDGFSREPGADDDLNLSRDHGQ